MSTREGRCGGKIVYASKGEELRGRDILCLHCGAHMHIHKDPLKDTYHFALNVGQIHKSVCANYDGNKNAPILMNSDEELVDMLSRLRVAGTKGTGGNGGTGGAGGSNGPVEPVVRRITNLKQIIETGIYDVFPYDMTYSGYRYLDLIIYAKWAKHVWQGNNNMVNIGARIVDVRWIGSFNYNFALRKRIIEKMDNTHDIWFSMFWKEDGKPKFVRFCVHCEESYNTVRNKLFKGGIRDNGTYDPYVPKNDPLDVLIAGRFGVMNEKQCHESCPLYPEMCSDCAARYWCLCNSVKQIEHYPANALTKNTKGNKKDD